MRLSASEGRECPMYFATMQKHAHSMQDAGCSTMVGGGWVPEGYRGADWMDHPFLSLLFFFFFNFFLLPATFGFNQRITGSVGRKWTVGGGGEWVSGWSYGDCFGRWSAAVGGPR